MDERVVLYGHDTMGLGHLRRNLALAAALRAGLRRPQVLIVSSVPESGRFPLPDGVDLLVLPGVVKRKDGTYRSRRLDAPLADIVALRRDVLTAALSSFAPDLVVVDKVALGFGGELEPVLPRLRAAGTRLVLGLRDVLDGPAAAAAEWSALRTTEALRAYYHEAWIYGDRRVSDLAKDCRVPSSVQHLFRYTGFLAQGRPAALAGAPPVRDGAPFVLWLLGGGQDGVALAGAFAAVSHPAGFAGVLVAGPYLPDAARATVRAATRADPGRCVVDFCVDPVRWGRHAAAVVCMGGYNTVTELLNTETPVLIVPRVTPRTEQLVRAQRLSQLGLVDYLNPVDLTPEPLATWLGGAVRRLRLPRTGIDLDGLRRVRRLADVHLEEARHAVSA
ncbi:MAG: glycosyltransferase family protein [Pseudonocardiaceae bacterium]